VHNQRYIQGIRLEISQQEFQELVQQIRELTARIYRLESLLRVSEASPRGTPPPPAVTLKPESAEVEQFPKPETPAVSAPPPPPPPLSPPPPIPPILTPEAPDDLESRIGSHWLNRIGIAAMLFGVSFFLKLAFDNNWIGPTGRIAIGLIAGIAVVVWSERFRSRGYQVFSYSLKAVGIGVLYLSLWAAFQVYHLMPSGVVFACMVVVTSATCVLALSQDAEILAVFAITGAFSTPVLLSTGQNREIALFSYLALLDIGILALTIIKPWRRLLLLGFVGTLGLYVSWSAEFYERSQLQPTLIFASIFFIIFAIAPLFMLAQEHAQGTMPLALALVNAATYFLQAYAMITEISHTAMAWFSLLLAAVYLLLIRARPRHADELAERNLRMMHLALAVGLITVAIPIRLEAHWITIGWFVEAAVLLWVADRIKSDLLNVFALTALVLGVGRLLLIDNFEFSRLVFNMRMAVYTTAIAALGFVAYQSVKREDETGKMIGAIAIIAMNLLALIALSREIGDYYYQEMMALRPGIWRPEMASMTRSLTITRDFSYSALWMAYGALLMTIGFWRASAFLRWQALVLIAFTIGKVFVYDISELDRVYRILSFIVLGILLLTISFAYQRGLLKLPSGKATAANRGGA
jgi:uncharacterized membrane protein